MRVNIEIPEEDVAELQAKAKAAGVTVEDYAQWAVLRYVTSVRPESRQHGHGSLGPYVEKG